MYVCFLKWVNSKIFFFLVGGPSVRSVSTSTKMIDGKAVKTTKKTENGQTDIKVEENGEE